MASTKGRDEDMETGVDSRYHLDRVLDDPGIDDDENETDSAIHSSAVKANKLITDPHSFNKGMIHSSFPSPKAN